MKPNKFCLALLPIMCGLGGVAQATVWDYAVSYDVFLQGAVTFIIGYDDVAKAFNSNTWLTETKVSSTSSNISLQLLDSQCNYSYSPGNGDQLVFTSQGCNWGSREITSVQISFLGSEPIENAGLPQSDNLGIPVTLDGSQSTDPYNNLLSYTWMVQDPSGMDVTLSCDNPPAPPAGCANTIKPQFTPDQTGDYIATLSVTDTVTKATGVATVTISSFNSPPVADAGQDILTTVDGNSVTLHGIGSDLNPSDILSFQWTFISVPVGSALTNAAITNSTSLSPSFIPDVHGDYSLQLVVSDNINSSQPSQVKVSFNNLPPVSNPGPSQTLTGLNVPVKLDGSQSYDPNGDSIAYAWSFNSVPNGSSARFSNPNIANTVFTPDISGAYVAQLTVTDPSGASDSSTTTVDIVVPPVSNAGSHQSAVVGNTVTLNGSGSNDAGNGNQLSYAWSLTSVPASSKAHIVNPNSVNPTFTADVAGNYLAQLVVTDTTTNLNSSASTVQVTVITVQTEAIQTLQTCQAILNNAPKSAFINNDLKNSLIRSLNDVIQDIDEQNYRDALSDISHDPLIRQDGCASGNKPDRDDWHKSCATETQVYNCLQPVVTELTGLSATQPKPKDKH